MRLILRIFHKPDKLVGVVKCTDCMVVKWESDDQVNESYRRFKLKAVELAEATSFRNAGISNQRKACVGLEVEKDGVKSTAKSNATILR